MIDEAFKEIMTNLKKTQEDVDRIRVDLNFEKEQRSKTYGRYMAEKDRNKKLQDKLDKIKEYINNEVRDIDGTIRSPYVKGISNILEE